PTERRRGKTYQSTPEEVELVNAALYLRRPLLVTGKPGTGKSTLVNAVAYELGLGPVLSWSITSRSTLQEGLYRYDAIARLQQASLVDRLRQSGQEGRTTETDQDDRDTESAANDPTDIGQFIRLGPLGTALLPAERPRALLIDEIDKSDIDLPNDLLHVFEEGRFEIPELVRTAGQHWPGSGASTPAGPDGKKRRPDR